jgi:nicotinamidase-related amidase
MMKAIPEQLLCDATSSQLVVIDIQDRLAAVMSDSDRGRVIRNTVVLLQAADLLPVATVVSEQYPRGLGSTSAVVAERIPADSPVVEKTCFACSANEGFSTILKHSERKQVILTGMETHVCVLQTAMELLAQEYQVFVVEDAVCSRSEINHRNALERMRAAGVVVTNTESVLFEWLRDARHEHFKAISALIK